MDDGNILVEYTCHPQTSWEGGSMENPPFPDPNGPIRMDAQPHLQRAAQIARDAGTLLVYAMLLASGVTLLAGIVMAILSSFPYP